MSEEVIDLTRKKPNIRPIQRSKLLDQAKAFTEELRKANESVQEYLDKGGDPRKYDITSLDGDEENVIQMSIMGLIDAECIEHKAVPLDSTPMPTEWRKAGSEQG